MDSKNDFYKTIFSYYFDVSKNLIPKEFIEEVSHIVTDYYYEQYGRFSKQYPKSIKRYSTFQIKDLDHPSTFEMVIKFFKKKQEDNYSEYSKILLKMTDDALKGFEKNREEFYRMF